MGELGAYRSLTFSIMPLPHSTSMQAQGWEGPAVLPSPSGVESGDACRQFPWELSQAIDH